MAPNASPDGHRIVFLYSTTDGSDHVWIMRADGSYEHPLVGDGWEARGATFTPNVRRVAHSLRPAEVAFTYRSGFLAPANGPSRFGIEGSPCG